MDEKVSVALIAAVASLAGAAIGGLTTYLVSHDGLTQQLTREEQQQRASPRGVARVYQDQLYGANNVLHQAQKNRRWPGRNDVGYFELPPIEDRRLVDSRLSIEHAARVREADEAMRAVASIIAVEPQQPLSETNQQHVVTWRKELENGSKALRELSH
jgi:hypothetical protein